MSAAQMSSYLREMRQFPLISREEEHDLAVRYRKTRDPRLAHKLAQAHLRLVVKIAHEYAWSGQSESDLIQAGNLGLLRAIEKYDPDRGVRLPSYASWWIRAHMIRWIVANWRLVRVGTTARQRRILRNLTKERRRVEAQGAAADPKVVAFLQHVTAPEVALDAPAPGRETPRVDDLEADADNRPDALVEKSEYLAAARDVIGGFASQLHGRDAVLFRERWGRQQQATLQQLGDRFGLSRERVRQLEARLLARLRRRLAVVALTVAAAACSQEVDDRPAQWSYISRAIIQPNCATSSCHSSLSATAELRLDTVELGYASLMDEGLVVPGAPEQSGIIAALRGGGEDGRRAEDDEAMPPDAPLPDADIDLIARWIAAGAEYD